MAAMADRGSAALGYYNVRVRRTLRVIVHFVMLGPTLATGALVDTYATVGLVFVGLEHRRV
jgi:hypothetical protein